MKEGWIEGTKEGRKEGRKELEVRKLLSNIRRPVFKFRACKSVLKLGRFGQWIRNT